MKQRFAKLLILVTPLALLITGAGAAYAVDPKATVLEGACTVGNTCSGQGVYDVISAVVNILSIIIGIAAIVAIMSGGLKYITSGGDSGKVANAKNTLIYAVIGLAIASLAQVIVHFVLNRVGRF